MFHWPLVLLHNYIALNNSEMRSNQSKNSITYVPVLLKTHSIGKANSFDDFLLILMLDVMLVADLKLNIVP